MEKDYNDDGSYIKNDKLFGYSVVYPYKNRDGSINWFNLTTGGSYGKLAVTIFIILLIIGSVYAYKKDVGTCYEVIKNPCEYCQFDPTIVNTDTPRLPTGFQVINNER